MFAKLLREKKGWTEAYVTSFKTLLARGDEGAALIKKHVKDLDKFVTDAVYFAVKKDYGADLPDGLAKLVAKKKWIGQDNSKLDFLPPTELRGRGMGTRSPKGRKPGSGGQIGIEEHHLLPQNDAMKAKFKAAEIEVDDFTIAVDFDLHKQIHNKMGIADMSDFTKNWNLRWQEFFKEAEKNGGTATRKDIFKFASGLVKEYAL
jgi:hypothetical protein